MAIALVILEVWIIAHPHMGHHLAELVPLAVLVPISALAWGAYLRDRGTREAQRAHLAELERIARHDELTGLDNHAYFRCRLRDEIERLHREGGSCALLLIDLDGFKDFNDRFGHAVGDALIRAIGEAICDEAGDAAIVSRYAGDEFALLLPDGDKAAAEELAASIVNRIEVVSVSASPANRHLKISASYGAAAYPGSATDADGLIAAADRALYDAKARRASDANGALERHAQDVFFAIGDAMGRSLEGEETIRNLVDAVGTSMRLDACSLRLMDADDQLRVRALYLPDAALRAALTETERQKRITRDEAAGIGLGGVSPVYVDDVAASQAVPERYRTAFPADMWLYNISIDGPREGMITLIASHERCAPPHTSLASAIARLAAAALRNCDVYASARRHGEQIAALSGMGAKLFGDGDLETRLGGVAEEIATVMGFDTVTIDTIDPEGTKPFLRQFYARPVAGREEQLKRAGEEWLAQRPALTEPGTVAFLAQLQQPIVYADVLDHPAIGARYQRIIAESGTRSLAIVPVTLRREVRGVVYFASYRKNAFDKQDIALMETIAAQLAPSLEIALLHVELQRSYNDLKEAHLEAILRLAYAAEARDPYTGRHLHRIKSFSEALARRLGLSGEALEALGYGAVVHDLGKLRIPDSILIKAGELTDDEWRVMKQHPEFGAEFLGKSAFYDVARQVAMHHHERWDGSGYPHRLAGEAIPLAARIVAVADVYDALTSDRPYKVAWPPERALAELIQMRGHGLAPDVVDAFIQLWNEGVIPAIEAETGDGSFAFDFHERYAA
jgi:diguanylate cyclase (GGDEF)-like protein